MPPAEVIRLPGGLTPERFLATCWQKRPAFLPGALPGFRPPLTIDEIAGLACEAEVESRLVTTHRNGKTVRYQAETGPFRASRLAALPDRDWTLLVHDIDRQLPELRPLLFAPRFLPAWRMGDLMVSVAAPGGSVGPHRDSYDVFLLQGDGHRRWQVGDGTRPRDESGLRLLADFQPDDEWDCHAGDVLYVPPGVGHHGVASTLCTTWSLGLQAPQLRDLAVYIGVDQEADPGGGRYADPDLTIDEVRGGVIAPAAVRRCREALALNGDTSDDEIAEALGRLLTMPKPAHRPMPPGGDEADHLLSVARRGRPLRPTEACACYESADGDGGVLFIAGESFATDAEAWPLALRLSHPDAAAGTSVSDVLPGSSAEALLGILCR
ncbi:MAG: cupin domain-containing protein, partial [Gammaproteobacteria bacterium]